MPRQEVASEWKGALTGGCPKGNNPNWRSNPQFALVPSCKGTFDVTISQTPGSSMLPIGLIVLFGKEGQPLSHPLRGDMIPPGGKTCRLRDGAYNVAASSHMLLCYQLAGSRPLPAGSSGAPLFSGWD